MKHHKDLNLLPEPSTPTPLKILLLLSKAPENSTNSHKPQKTTLSQKKQMKKKLSNIELHAFAEPMKHLAFFLKKKRSELVTPK